MRPLEIFELIKKKKKKTSPGVAWSALVINRIWEVCNVSMQADPKFASMFRAVAGRTQEFPFFGLYNVTVETNLHDVPVIWQIHTHTQTHTHSCSVRKEQWSIPAHISPVGDNCAISQRVAGTLFTARCGGVGGVSELMSSERENYQFLQIQTLHKYTHKHTQRQSADCHSSVDKQAILVIGMCILFQNTTGKTEQCTFPRWDTCALLWC